MSEDNFKVIYTGELREGFEIEPVAKNFAKKFKISPEKALSILQAGRETTLNKKSKHVMAYKFKSAFEEMGMQVRLERIMSLVPNQEIEEPEDNKEQEEKQNTQENNEKPNEDEHFEHTEKLKKASESWTLDPIEQKKATDQIVNDDPDNTVEKSDFNYTGLADSPVIGVKKQPSENSDPKTEEQDNVETKQVEIVSEKPSALIGFLKKIGLSKLIQRWL